MEEGASFVKFQVIHFLFIDNFGQTVMNHVFATRLSGSHDLARPNEGAFASVAFGFHRH
jgi:hypothetical protein